MSKPAAATAAEKTATPWPKPAPKNEAADGRASISPPKTGGGLFDSEEGD
jgi:hypothetical protein